MYWDGGKHQLTYCTNIHPANGWPEVRANLAQYAPALKSRFAPDAPFGLGLRLSAAEARQLLSGDCLREFRDFLTANGLYVALINGYPYGHFSGEPVKAQVFAPDWRTPERLNYTLDLIAILSALLPEGSDGGVSTVPLSYKPWIDGRDNDVRAIVRNVAEVCRQLVLARRESGRMIHLDIEPEPDGLLETTGETVAFFTERLPDWGAPVLAEGLGCPLEEACSLLREHVRVCYDTCHFAVQFEDPATTLGAFAAAGVKLGRVQVSSALAVPLEAGAPGAGSLARLREMNDAVYLHQVVEQRRDGSLRRYRDLPEALARPLDREAIEWRIHFHVPLFAPDFGGLGSTREAIRRTFQANPAATHFEIETYTWSVLPANLRFGLGDSISREYAWVLDELCAKPSS
ncbi:MAG TPA: metabolite traffic protein EboE [Bryobacteraceae bacterium]|nr:metabolite traffic protein EboE [Bryobacteraceae bacterium]